MGFVTVIVAIALNICGTSASINAIVPRLILQTDILTELPSASITSCFMACSARINCKGIGYRNDPGTTSNEKCLLLKDVTGVDEDEKDEKDAVRLFLIINVSLIFKISI